MRRTLPAELEWDKPYVHLRYGWTRTTDSGELIWYTERIGDSVHPMQSCLYHTFREWVRKNCLPPEDGA